MLRSTDHAQGLRLSSDLAATSRIYTPPTPIPWLSAHSPVSRSMPASRRMSTPLSSVQSSVTESPRSSMFMPQWSSASSAAAASLAAFQDQERIAQLERSLQEAQVLIAEQ